MTSPGGLAADYRAARARFLAAAEGASASVERQRHPDRGPANEELAVDLAWLGPADSAAVVLVVSGTHGVEGFAGSMCQSRWLEQSDRAPLPDRVSVVFLHAFNPYGFAWVRRVNEDNVDLNRNFADFADPPENTDYDELAAALAPVRWTDEARSVADATIVDWANEHGWDRLPAAISGGQYHHPDGLFYGGSEPTWSHRILEEIVAARLARAEQVVLLDLHTGLGEWGEIELISHELPGSDAFERSVQWWGDRVASTEGDGESNSASLAGEWMPAVQRWLSSAEVTGTALEWGTLDSIQVLQALRADNWLHQHGDPAGPDAPAIKAELRAAFAPDDGDWCEGVWRDFAHYVDGTLAALAD